MWLYIKQEYILILLSYLCHYNKINCFIIESNPANRMNSTKQYISILLDVCDVCDILNNVMGT